MPAVPSHLRRAAAILLAGCLTVPLLAAASPKPAPRAVTSIAISTITDPSGSANQGGKTLVGDRLVVTGKASKNLIGRTLRVEMRDGARWKRIPGRATVAKGRTFSISSRAAAVGARTYRVAFAGSRTLKPSSAGSDITAWRWFPVADLPRVSTVEAYVGNAPGATDQVTVAGHTYSDVLMGRIYSARPSSSDFTVGYRCSDLSTTIGLGDSSVSGSSGVFTVYRDGVQAATQTLPLGASSTFALDLHGVFRIRFEHSAIVAADDYDPVFPSWPEARVLCSANPA